MLKKVCKIYRVFIPERIVELKRYDEEIILYVGTKRKAIRNHFHEADLPQVIFALNESLKEKKSRTLEFNLGIFVLEFPKWSQLKTLTLLLDEHLKMQGYKAYFVNNTTEKIILKDTEAVNM